MSAELGIDSVARNLDATRKPVDDVAAGFYLAQRALSFVMWDLYAREAHLHYRRAHDDGERPQVGRFGFVQGCIAHSDAARLRDLFPVERIPFVGPDHSPRHYYDPRVPLHDSSGVNIYYRPSAALKVFVETLLGGLRSDIAVACGHYWRVASWRVFELREQEEDHAFHVDGWPPAIKKLFFYPAGVGRDLGTTEFQGPDGEVRLIEGPAGTWALFENSVVLHRAHTAEAKVRRPTIELDLVPALVTDVTIPDTGLNGWYPWFPLWADDDASLPAYLRYPEVERRLLGRLLGLAGAVPNRDLSGGQDTYINPRDGG